MLCEKPSTLTTEAIAPRSSWFLSAVARESLDSKSFIAVTSSVFHSLVQVDLIVCSLADGLIGPSKNIYERSRCSILYPNVSTRNLSSCGLSLKVSRSQGATFYWWETRQTRYAAMTDTSTRKGVNSCPDPTVLGTNPPNPAILWKQGLASLSSYSFAAPLASRRNLRH